MSEKSKEVKLSIDLPEDMVDGIYSNLAVVNHSDYEFVIDFISVMPAVSNARVKSRIVLNPIHAKKLLTALEENIKNYESKSGKIEDTSSISIPISMKPLGEA